MPKHIGHITPVFEGEETGNQIGYKDHEHRKQIIAYLVECNFSYQIYISEQEMIRIEKKLLTFDYKRRTLSL